MTPMEKLEEAIDLLTYIFNDSEYMTPDNILFYRIQHLLNS